MKKIVTKEHIRGAIEQIREQGGKVSRRAVLAITGGGMSTVHQIMDEIAQEDTARAAAPSSEISSTLTAAILAEVGRQVQVATTALMGQLEAAQGANNELTSELAWCETEAERIAIELANQTARAENQRQEAEKAQAVATQEILDLRARVEALEIERRQLIEAGESARTEAAKALVQVERADQAASKAEKRIRDLEQQVQTAQEEKAQAEKAQAVAEQRAQGLESQTGKLDKSMEQATAKIEAMEERAREQERKIEELLRAAATGRSGKG
jgi:chromosome segregation ATPase